MLFNPKGETPDAHAEGAPQVPEKDKRHLARNKPAPTVVSRNTQLQLALVQCKVQLVDTARKSIIGSMCASKRNWMKRSW